MMEDLSRRAFLGLMGSMAATALVGCGSGNEHIDIDVDGGTNPHDAGPIPTPDAAAPDAGPSTYSLQGGYAQLPCHYPAALALLGTQMATVCTTGGSMPGDYNHLSQFDTASAARPIASSDLVDLDAATGRSINKFARLSATRGVITANDGIYEVPLSGAGSPRFIPFPAGTSYATGAMRIGNKLFVATGNLTVASSSYGPGAVQVYDLASDGSILDGSRRSMATSRLNPTGLALQGTNTLIVLNSGDYTAVAAASLDIVNPTSEIITRTIQLGSLTAQNADRVALTDDGLTAVIGSADGSGRILFVDLQTGTVSERSLSGTQFHSSVKIGNGRVFVTDFNSGKLTIMDLISRSILQSLSLMTTEAGPSELLGNDLVQAVPYGAFLVHAA